MHKYNQETQYNECLICHTTILSSLSFAHLVKNLPLCTDCINQFEIIDQTIDFHHYPLRILYAYNDFFRSLLFQYKGLYDYALKDAFLCIFHEELQKRYNDYLVVTTPSWKDDNIQRGFAPIPTLAYTFTSQVFLGLYKKEKYKQSALSYEERKQVKEKIGIKDGEQLRGRKVLIMDDVITSGSTLKACLSCVLEYQPASVELLVLAAKRSVKE